MINESRFFIGKKYFGLGIDICFVRVYIKKVINQAKDMNTLTLRYPHDWGNSNNGGDYAHYCAQRGTSFIIFWSSSEMTEENVMIGYHRGTPIIVTRHECYGRPIFEVEGLQSPSILEDENGIFINGVHFTPIEHCESAQFNTAENWARQCVHAAQALIEQNEIETQKEALIYA